MCSGVGESFVVWMFVVCLLLFIFLLWFGSQPKSPSTFVGGVVVMVVIAVAVAAAVTVAVACVCVCVCVCVCL